MIYKRGCDKKGTNGTCSKCGRRGSSGVYWYKFMWQGKLIRESTKQGNDKVARQMEAAHRTSLAKGEVGIRDTKLAPTRRVRREAFCSLGSISYLPKNVARLLPTRAASD
jgi:hypothetical protein